MPSWCGAVVWCEFKCVCDLAQPSFLASLSREDTRTPESTACTGSTPYLLVYKLDSASLRLSLLLRPNSIGPQLADVDEAVAEFFLMEESPPADVLREGIRRATLDLAFVPVRAVVVQRPAFWIKVALCLTVVLVSLERIRKRVISNLLW